jgi:lysophospholipase
MLKDSYKLISYGLMIIWGLVWVALMPRDLPASQEDVSPCFDFITTHDGCSIRYGVWPCDKEERRGTIILLGGRTEFMEKHFETIAELNQRDFDVYSFDWRGQGLSTRMLPNRHKGFVKNYDSYIKDLDLFITKIVKPKATSPLIILAHSMGGHITIRFLKDHPDVIDRAVLISPMIDICTSPLPGWLVESLAKFAVKIGLEKSYVIGSGDYPPNGRRFDGNKMTSDPERFMDEKKAVFKNPDLALGGVTYGWLAKTYDSMKTIAEPGYARRIKTSVLIIGAELDEIVCLDAEEAFCSAMANCTFRMIAGSHHEILKETDAIRSLFWDEFDKFTGSRPVE